MNRRYLLAAALLCAATGASLSQAAPSARDKAMAVEVVKAKGDFALKLNGTVPPTGKGWKTASDKKKRLQVMLPDRWKVETAEEEEIILRATPPGTDKDSPAQLLITFSSPADSDPLDISEAYALSYAEELAENPSLKQLKFKPTDSGYVLARGLRFALAGGTLVGEKKQVLQQEQLVFVGDDRIVTLQLVAPEKDFPRLADDLAKIFASYQNLGVTKLGDD
jgi:hypothetical protein